MDLKNFFLVGILMLAILTIGAVSASDENITSDKLAIDEDLVVESSLDDIELESDDVKGDLIELVDLINSTPDGGVLKLDKDYQYGTHMSTSIIISKSMTIDGQGHTLDADYHFRIFYINNSDVTLKNINFINTYKFNTHGGAVYFTGSGNVINCSFSNSISGTGDYWAKGGAIYFGGTGNVINSSFINCRATDNGGAVYFSTPGNVYNSYFENCHSVYTGRSVYSASFISNCTFIRSSSDVGAAAVFTNGKNSTVVDCNFINCSGVNGEGASINYVIHSSFINCSGHEVGAISGTSNVIGSYFENCSSNYGRAISFGVGSSLVNSSFVDCYWYSDNSLDIANVTINNEIYGPSLWECYNENNQIILTDDYEIINSPIYIGADNVVIDGNGHTITSNFIEYVEKTFYITGNNVILKNIIFNNSNVYSKGLNSTLINCTFTDIHDHNEKAVNFDNGNIINCTFKNMACNVAIYFDNIIKKDANVINSTFSDFYIFGGGSIVFHSGNVVGCNFTNCTSEQYASTIYCKDTCNIINSIFINNMIVEDEDSKASVYIGGSNSHIENSIFIGDEWFCDYPVELVNVKVNDIEIGLWDVLKDNDQIALDKDGIVYFSPISITANNVVINGKGHKISSDLNRALFVSGDNVTLKNIIFNHSTIFSDGFNTTFINCSFVDCYSIYNGGAVYFEKFANVINCSFNGISRYALYFYCTKGNIINCSFVDCWSALYLENSGSNVVNCIFINCSDDYACAIASWATNNISGCKFINCFGEGAIRFEKGCVEDSSFINCTGAIYMHNGGNIINCNFTNCSIDKVGGGAISVYSSSIIAGCKFVNCTDSRGDAVRFSEVKCHLINSSFVGGNWFARKPVNISNVIVEGVYYHSSLNNILQDNSKVYLNPDDNIYGSPFDVTGNNVVIDGRGNTIYGDNNPVFDITGKNVTVKNIIFVNAGLFTKDVTNKIINCTFINSSSYDYYDSIGESGGAIYGRGDIINSSFINCAAPNKGGAIYSNQGNIINCSFINCSANYGGGINGVVNVFNSTFVSCDGGYWQEGSAINLNGNGVIDNCTFINNMENVVYMTKGNITNCKFTNCSRVIESLWSINVLNSNFENSIGIRLPGGSSIVDCNFNNCEGNIDIQTAIIDGCSFNNCSYDSGPIVSVWKDSSITYCSFNNCTYAIEGFVNNYASNCNFTNIRSRAIYFYSIYDDDRSVITVYGSSNIDNCIFINCNSDGDGGSIYLDMGNITNCSFINCFATNRTVYNGRIRDFVNLLANGGAIYLAYEGNIANCSFVNCSTKGEGGAVYIYGFEASHRRSIVDADESRYIWVPCKIINSTFEGSYDKNDESWVNKSYVEFNNVTVKKVNSYIGISDIELDYGEECILEADLIGVKNIIANVIGHEEVIVDIQDNKIKISNLNASNYILNVTGIPKSNFLETSILVNITVKKVNSSLEFNNIDYEEDFIKYYSVFFENAYGVTAYVDDSSVNVEVMDDFIIVSDLKIGNYTLYVTTVPDSNHNPVTKTVDIIVKKQTPKLSVDVKNINYGQPSEITVSLSIDENVTLQINGQKYTKKVSNGKATFIISDLYPKEYDIKVTFEGNEIYGPITVSSSFDVLKIETPSISLSKTIKDDNNFTVRFDGNVTGKVTFTVNVGSGTQKYVVELVNGEGSFNVSHLSNGVYNYGLSYSGDKIYYSYTMPSNEFTIDRAVKNETISPEIIIPPLDNLPDDGSVSVSLPSDATGTVTLTINGVDYVFDVVGGVANVKLPDLANGNYTYSIKYSGDSKYSSFTSSGSVNVNNVPVYDPKVVASNANVVYSAGSYYTIKVYGTDGKLANGAKVVIKVNEKSFKTLTTSNGVVKFKVTQVPGTYKVQATALGKSVTKTLTVKHLVTLKSATVKKSAKKLVIQASLGKVSGKYLKNKKITFKFNGKKYTAKTNSKGVAKVTIQKSVLGKLKVGKKITYQTTYLKDTVKKSVKVKK